MKILLIGISLLCVSFSAIADECAAWGCRSIISSLQTDVEGIVYIGTPFDETQTNCTPVLNQYFTLNPSSSNAKEVYSSLLAAFMSGKKIQLRIKEGHPNCELAYTRLDAPS